MTRTKSNRSEKNSAASHQGGTVSPKEAAWIRKAGTSKNVSLGRQNARKKRHPAASLAATVKVPARSLIQPKIPLRGATLEVSSQFRVHTALVTILPSGRRPIHWQFLGADGSVTVELPQKQAWDLLEDLQEQSIRTASAMRSNRARAK
jgi:hypothetical protein